MTYRKQTLVKAEKFDDLLIVQCGTKIKYTQLEDTSYAEKLDNMLLDNDIVSEFKDADINFSDNVEISEIKDFHDVYVSGILWKSPEAIQSFIFYCYQSSFSR